MERKINTTKNNETSWLESTLIAEELFHETHLKEFDDVVYSTERTAMNMALKSFNLHLIAKKYGASDGIKFLNELKKYKGNPSEILYILSTNRIAEGIKTAEVCGSDFAFLTALFGGKGIAWNDEYIGKYSFANPSSEKDYKEFIREHKKELSRYKGERDSYRIYGHKELFYEKKVYDKYGGYHTAIREAPKKIIRDKVMNKKIYKIGKECDERNYSKVFPDKWADLFIVVSPIGTFVSVEGVGGVVPYNVLKDGGLYTNIGVDGKLLGPSPLLYNLYNSSRSREKFNFL